ncbi:MAG: hypothetical protein IIW54_06705 [Lachnospiraceae bacterium]|nr:hypothetical protein [Lachnospiraceae bacterium]
MKIEMYDKVKLKTGEIAFIVEIYEQGIAYEADIEKKEGIETDTIKHSDIEYVFADNATERTA